MKPNLTRLASYLTLGIVWLCACFLFGLNQWTSMGRILIFTLSGTALLLLILSRIRDEQFYSEVVEMLLVMGLLTAGALLLSLILGF